MSTSAVLERFGITNARVRRLPRGEVNDLWVVDTGADRFVLKRTYPERLPHHTLREHDVLRVLVDAGWSVPCPIPSDDGTTIVRHDDRTWWLSRWLRGRQPVTTEQSVRRLGAILAALHADLAPLAGRPGLEGDFGVRSLRSRAVARHGWTFEDGMAALEKDDPRRGTRLRREVERVASALDALPVGPTVVCHGDLHTGNLLVHRGATSVIDFDFAHPQERAADVAISLSLLDDQRLAPAIVDGYTSVSPLDDAELGALAVMFDARLLHHAAWLLFRWSRGEVHTAALDTTFARLGTCGS